MLASQLERDHCGEEWREADVLGVELRQAPPECGSAVSSAHPQLSSPPPPSLRREEKQFGMFGRPMPPSSGVSH